MFFLGKLFQKVFGAAKRVRGEVPRVVCVGDGSKHASLVSAVGPAYLYNAYLLKGKYPQVQILQSLFPAGVTVERGAGGLWRPGERGGRGTGAGCGGRRLHEARIRRQG